MCQILKMKQKIMIKKFIYHIINVTQITFLLSKKKKLKTFCNKKLISIFQILTYIDLCQCLCFRPCLL